MAKIFLCYAREDEAQVRDVYARLRALGFELWMDKINLIPGQRWRQEIPRALRASDFVLVFLSQHSATKQGFVQREFKLALDILEEMPEGVIHTIPIRLGECTVPEQFDRLQWCDLFEEDGFERLQQALRAGLLGRQQPWPKGSTVPAAKPALINRNGMEFMLIPAGEFVMGSTDGSSDEQPVHTVRISQPFCLGMYAVKQGQWEAVMEKQPRGFTGNRNHPVERVSWEDIQEFIQRLNAKEDDAIYRLPREAEWEYACRAGSTTAYFFGDDPSQLGQYAWYEDNSGYTTHPVGQKRPNAWGLYDMHGNVWEWVQDWYGDYAPEPVTDPEGPVSGLGRVIRGGSWGNVAGSCRSAFRLPVVPGGRIDNLGFRLLREVR